MQGMETKRRKQQSCSRTLKATKMYNQWLAEINRKYYEERKWKFGSKSMGIKNRTILFYFNRLTFV